MKPALSLLGSANDQVAVPANSSSSQIVSAACHDPRLRFSNIDLRTGVRIHFGEQGDPDGMPVIFLHGYTDSSFSYSMVVPLLDQNYRVFVLDQRGHGDSERPGQGYSFDDFARDILAFMDSMGLKQATIVGHCMGSFVAQHVATIAPERVTRLVLIASAPTVCSAEVLGLQKAVSDLSDSMPEDFVREFQTSTIFNALPEQFVDKVVKESLKLPLTVWKSVINGIVSSNDGKLNKIQTPTLVVWGDKDTIFERSAQDSLVSTLPNAKLKIYADTGHAPHWERPQEFAKDLQDFIAEK